MATVKKKSPASPVFLTQEELDELKAGKGEQLHKRIVLQSPVAKAGKKSSPKKSLGSPVKLSAEQLTAIKKTGKLPKDLAGRIEKEDRIFQTGAKKEYVKKQRPSLKLPHH